MDKHRPVQRTNISSNQRSYQSFGLRLQSNQSSNQIVHLNFKTIQISNRIFDPVIFQIKLQIKFSGQV